MTYPPPLVLNVLFVLFALILKTCPCLKLWASLTTRYFNMLSRPPWCLVGGFLNKQYDGVTTDYTHRNLMMDFIFEKTIMYGRTTLYNLIALLLLLTCLLFFFNSITTNDVKKKESHNYPKKRLCVGNCRISASEQWVKCQNPRKRTHSKSSWNIQLES